MHVQAHGRMASRLCHTNVGVRLTNGLGTKLHVNRTGFKSGRPCTSFNLVEQFTNWSNIYIHNTQASTKSLFFVSPFLPPNKQQ